ncbi:MAG: hypothetical protein JNN01_01895 [Opitutaceae bacterium]|nr:hypothetical protein [Opitutaceae bacterium]
MRPWLALALIGMAGVSLKPAIAFEAKAPVDPALMSALRILSFETPPTTSEELGVAMKVYIAFEKTETSQRVRPPAAAMAWVPNYGPCSMIEPFLELVFIASFQNDQLLGKSTGSVHRGWLSVIKAYRSMLSTPGSDPVTIESIEAMIEKEAKGSLAAEGARIEAEWARARKDL